MTRWDRPALIASLILFGVFFANVSIGASSGSPPMGDVVEMLCLFASAIAFVVGVIAREARERGTLDVEDVDAPS